MTEAEREAIRPVLEVANKLVNDRTEGQERRAGRFLEYRFDMERALAKLGETVG